MNTIILQPDQFLSENEAVLNPRQADHLRRVLKPAPDTRLHVGRLDGLLGDALSVDAGDSVYLRDIALYRRSPPQLPLTLFLALPRPQMLKRILQLVATYGVERLILFQSHRVEKSYWQTPSLQAHAVWEQLLLGLEQANATQMPECHCVKYFRELCEDWLPRYCPQAMNYVAHPGDFDLCPSAWPASETTFAIGPEGGFTQAEFACFREMGFSPVQLGQRILKVEQAVNCVLARLM